MKEGQGKAKNMNFKKIKTDRSRNDTKHKKIQQDAC